MSRDLLVGLLGVVLLIAALPIAERALLKATRRHLDRSRRAIRALIFLAGVAAWAYLSYVPLYELNRQWWFLGFLLVAGAWKLIVDVLIFGARNRPD